MTFYLPNKPSKEFFRDFDDVLTTVKRYEDKKKYVFDFSGELDSGDTISSVSWESDGPTLSSESNDTTTLTVFVQYTGEATATVTTSNGNSIELKLRFLGSDNTSHNDYGN